MVAVLDSGVDAGPAPLRDRLLPGTDELDATDERVDCVGHGTAVAGIIAALAPGARILPVRVTEREELDGTGRGTMAAWRAGVVLRDEVNADDADLVAPPPTSSCSSC